MWLKKFVKTLSATTTVLSASCASVQPASSAACQAASLTLPRLLDLLLATVSSACSFGSLLVAAAGVDRVLLAEAGGLAASGVRGLAVGALVDGGDDERDGLAGLAVEGAELA